MQYAGAGRTLIISVIALLLIIVEPLTNVVYSPTALASPAAQLTGIIVVNPSTTGEPKSAADIFADISPAVAFVETGIASGSGLLLESGHILSNAHVVWPFRSVRVVFPDGSEYREVPVIGWDLMADLALLGPVETDLEGIPLYNGNDMAIGSNIFLIGYPAEVEEFPRPAITTGILSRTRVWDAIDYTFFQVDATIAGGQSGGIMVNERGEVIGITTFFFSEFGLAGSIGDAAPRLNGVMRRSRKGFLIRRKPNLSTRWKADSDVLNYRYEQHVYAISEPINSEISLTLTADSAPNLAVFDIYGFPVVNTLLQQNRQEGEPATLEFTTEVDAPYFVVVEAEGKGTAAFVLESSHALAKQADTDDYRYLYFLYDGEPAEVAGSIDTPIDQDAYGIYLEAGQIYEFEVDSIAIDPTLTLHAVTEGYDEVINDVNSGGGLFGTNATITYRAPVTGEYFIYVGNASPGQIGGYILRAAGADDAAALSRIDERRELVIIDDDRLAWYDSPNSGVSLLYPANWFETFELDCVTHDVHCFAGNDGLLLIGEQSYDGVPAASLEEFEALLGETQDNPDFELVDLQKVRTRHGLSIYRAHAVGDGLVNDTLLYVDPETEIFHWASYIINENAYTDYATLVDYAFSNFQILTAEERRERQIASGFIVDENAKIEPTATATTEPTATSTAEPTATPKPKATATPTVEPTPTPRAEPTVEAAAEPTATPMPAAATSEPMADVGDQGISDEEADDEEADDGQAGGRQGELDAVATKSDLYDSAYRGWVDGDNDAALKAITDLLSIAPQRADAYNLRAQIYIAQQSYENALADIRSGLAVADDAESVRLMETKGFALVQMNRNRAARTIYRALLADDEPSLAALLGAAAMYVGLGDSDQAQRLLEQAAPLLEQTAGNARTPDVAALLETLSPLLQ